MKVGDVVAHAGQRWKVLTHNQDVRTCILVGFEGARLEVPDDLQPPDLEVLCNPADSWPFVPAPIRPRAGPVLKVVRGQLGLAPFDEWVPSDFNRPGGSIFFNPKLRLRAGEVLAAQHKDGTRSRINITHSFGTVQQRQARALKPRVVKGPLGALDQLLADDSLDDD